MSSLSIWQPASADLVPSTASTPAQIANCAAQLSAKDKKQIVSAFEAGHYEMALNHLWGKTVSALKKELSTVGVGLLAEMLGKADVDEDEDVDDILTAKEAIRLAEELGIINNTDALRLRHAHEFITHFSQMETETSDLEDIDPTEAVVALKSCVRGVLGRPKIEVAKKFVEFRLALEGERLAANDPRVDMLKSSPYFFSKLTISVLLNAARKKIGANLEHVLANINVLVPSMWPNLRETEKWQIGRSYAEAYSEGKSTVVSGLKSALLKVRGFDYVPENLRSDTFVKAAEAILAAHDGLNNFYNEPAHVKHLRRLGSTIPTPAIPACLTALISVVLGNSYGVSWTAQPDAMTLLKQITPERWQYYFNNVLPSDARILSKLLDEKPSSNWIDKLNELQAIDVDVKSKLVAQLLSSTKSKDQSKVNRIAKALMSEYYGKLTS